VVVKTLAGNVGLGTLTPTHTSAGHEELTPAPEHKTPEDRAIAKVTPSSIFELDNHISNSKGTGGDKPIYSNNMWDDGFLPHAWVLGVFDGVRKRTKSMRTMSLKNCQKHNSRSNSDKTVDGI
jgi:hypothetical protein